MRMKVSKAALSFLILAAALGSQAQNTLDIKIKEIWNKVILPPPLKFMKGSHNPSDCCFSYTSRRIRCTFIEDYFETSGCPKPGVIFITKRGRRVCADPRDSLVQQCMKVPTNVKPRTRKLAWGNGT